MVEGKRRTLNRARVLAAALDLADRDGLDALSMRRLAQTLGVEAMSLYNHVPGKAAMLDGIVELLLSELEIPPPGAGDWQERVRGICRSFRRLAHAHPRAFPLVVTRPYTTAAALARVEAALQVVRDAGFDAVAALRVFQACSSYTAGYALAEVTRALPSPEADGEGGELVHRRLNPREFPQLFALQPYYADRDRDAEFEFGLDAVLIGLQAKLQG